MQVGFRFFVYKRLIYRSVDWFFSIGRSNYTPEHQKDRHVLYRYFSRNIYRNGLFTIFLFFWGYIFSLFHYIFVDINLKLFGNVIYNLYASNDVEYHQGWWIPRYTNHLCVYILHHITYWFGPMCDIPIMQPLLLAVHSPFDVQRALCLGPPPVEAGRSMPTSWSLGTSSRCRVVLSAGPADDVAELWRSGPVGTPMEWSPHHY